MNQLLTGIGIAIGFCLAVDVCAALGQLIGNPKPLDSTDDPVTQTRSGMRIKVDHQTGCQYLTTASGGITPRLDITGRLICSKA